tara:strand:+ start:2153 stop:3139 length:987 start_codon:yes stop_codon:yes gene_type:complete
MAINYPLTTNQPTDGSFTHTASGITWSWDGTSWVAQGDTSYYTLPTASTGTLGGVKVDGTSVTIAAGVISASATVASINQITDVTVTSASPNDILSWNGSAWVNQQPSAQTNAFNTIAVSGQSNVVADSTSDTLTFVPGSNITITTDAASDQITIASSATTISVLNDIGNVTITNATPGQVLKWDGSAWINDTDDTGGSASGLQSRTTANATTSTISNNQSTTLTITAAKTYALHKIQTSHAAWVTLYTDSSSRNSDQNRTETTDPLPGAGVIAEVITSDGATQPITPGTIGWNDDGTPGNNAYLRVVNKSGSSVAITVTLHFVPLEA